MNHQYLKNIVGTFATEYILVYPEFLKTLDFVELRSGLQKMLNTVNLDVSHWNNLIHEKNLHAENIAPHIENSMMIKENCGFKRLQRRKLEKF